MDLGTAAAVRAALSAAVGEELDESAWQQLVESGHVGDVTLADDGPGSRERAFRALVGQYRAIAGQPRTPPKATIELDPDGETLVRADAIAAAAAAHPQVVAFRRRFLAGGLLGWDEVASWLASTAEREGPPAMLLHGVICRGEVEISLDAERPGVYPVEPLTISATNPARGSSMKTLAYALRGDRGVRRMYVQPDGTLDLLAGLSAELATLHGWQPAQAAVFVLAGVVPVVSRGVATLNATASSDGLSARVILTVDPALPERSVVNLYQRARRELLAPIGVKPRRPRALRPLSERNVALAAFAATAAEGTYPVRMAEWNRLHPEWSYKDQRTFRRDFLRVRSRTTGTQEGQP